MITKIKRVYPDVLANDPTHLVSEMDFITKLYQYEQLIKDPTRVTKDSASLIDPFYTTKSDYIASSGVKIITISDHYLIYGVRKSQATKQSPRIIEYRDFKQFNETHFLFELQSSINLNLEYWDPNDSWSIWKNTFLNIVNRHAPLKKRRVSSKRLPSITKDLIIKKRQKAFLKKKAALSGLEANWTIYKSAKNSYNRLVKRTIRQYYQDKLQIDTKDPKKCGKPLTN